MKKLVISLIVASAALFGMGSVTSAQYGSTTTTTTTVAKDSGAVAPAAPAAAAPAAETPSAGLPATGSDGIGTTTGIAFGLLAVGLGLFIVTRVRRRHPDAAA